MKLNFAVCTALVLALTLLWSPPSYGQDGVTESEIFLPFVVGGQSNTDGELVDVGPEVQAATTYNFSAVVTGTAKEEWFEPTLQSVSALRHSDCCGNTFSTRLPYLSDRTYTLTADVTPDSRYRTTATAIILHNNNFVAGVSCSSYGNDPGNCPQSNFVQMSGGSYTLQLRIYSTQNTAVSGYGNGQGKAQLSYEKLVPHSETYAKQCTINAVVGQGESRNIGRCPLTFQPQHGGTFIEKNFTVRTIENPNVSVVFDDTRTTATTSESATLLATGATPPPPPVDPPPVDPPPANPIHFYTLPTYQTGVQYNESPSTLYDILSADINGDGDNDLVHVRTDQGGKLIFLPYFSDGAGSFTSTGIYRTNMLYNEAGKPFYRVQVADINGDGRDDLIHVRTDNGGTLIYLPFVSDGTGNFTINNIYGTNTRYNYGEETLYDLLVADINGDGNDDLVHIYTAVGKVWFLTHFADGNGGFNIQASYATNTLYNEGGAQTLYGVLPADIDGDGRDDLVHFRTDNGGELIFLPYLSHGDGLFTIHGIYRTGISYNGGEETLYRVLVADLNNDNRDDLLHVRTDDGGKIVYIPHLADGNGSFTPQTVYHTDTPYKGTNDTIYNILTADINGDNRDDLLHIRTDNSGLYTLAIPTLSTDTGGFNALEQQSLAINNGQPNWVLLSDVNDSHADLIYTQINATDQIEFSVHLSTLAP